MRIRLECEDISVGLNPELGGSLSHFRYRGLDILRPTAADETNILNVSMFPMIPYAGRVPQNKIVFEGNVFLVEQNNPPERYNVHGSAWQMPWSVVEFSKTSCLIELEVDKKAAPFNFIASQRFDLTREAVEISISVRNTGKVRMPFGVGLHPWFFYERDARLKFTAAGTWLSDLDGAATDRLSIPPELDFSAARTLPPWFRLLCYDGWDGRAEISWPRRGVGVVMRADGAMSNLQMYWDPERSAFCVEPQSNVAAAWGLVGVGRRPEELGLFVLEPGGERTLKAKFSPFALGSSSEKSAAPSRQLGVVPPFPN